jgi:hypothetical protein
MARTAFPDMPSTTTGAFSGAAPPPGLLTAGSIVVATAGAGAGSGTGPDRLPITAGGGSGVGGGLVSGVCSGRRDDRVRAGGRDAFADAGC